VTSNFGKLTSPFFSHISSTSLRFSPLLSELPLPSRQIARIQSPSCNKFSFLPPPFFHPSGSFSWFILRKTSIKTPVFSFFPLFSRFPQRSYLFLLPSVCGCLYSWTEPLIFSPVKDKQRLFSFPYRFTESPLFFFIFSGLSSPLLRFRLIRSNRSVFLALPTVLASDSFLNGLLQFSPFFSLLFVPLSSL